MALWVKQDKVSPHLLSNIGRPNPLLGLQPCRGNILVCSNRIFLLFITGNGIHKSLTYHPDWELCSQWHLCGRRCVWESLLLQTEIKIIELESIDFLSRPTATYIVLYLPLGEVEQSNKELTRTWPRTSHIPIVFIPNKRTRKAITDWQFIISEFFAILWCV